jgi:hypothetical protein
MNERNFNSALHSVKAVAFSCEVPVRQRVDKCSGNYRNILIIIFMK